MISPCIYSQWHTERSTKKVHAIEEINVLSGKMDELMKFIASKSTPIDPNDMPLSTLIENNNESMDVNFVGRNSFGNNAYRGKGRRPRRPFPSSTADLSTFRQPPVGAGFHPRPAGDYCRPHVAAATL